jgi:predicted nucleic acid-binding protein
VLLDSVCKRALPVMRSDSGREDAGRIWELRHNVISYDAWYVALAASGDAAESNP